MAVIERNDYGAIAVNKSVIEKLIVEDLLSMSDDILLCNKKGKLIKENPTPFIDPDYYDAVDLSEKKGYIKVKLYLIIRFGSNISETAERLFDMIEKDFEMLRLNRPNMLTMKVRGILSDEIVKRSIDVVRNND
jgi:uncharacterized alkaline shock family protein YloU